MYNIHYFIRKFGAIPDWAWSDRATGKECPIKDFMGHMNSYPDGISEEGSAFIEIATGHLPADPIGRVVILYMINDGEGEWERTGSTPKERWLNYLNSLVKSVDIKPWRTDETNESKSDALRVQTVDFGRYRTKKRVA